MKKRLYLLLLFIFSLTFYLTLPTAAEADGHALVEKLPDEYGDLLNALPEELLERLPDELFSKDGETLGEGVQKISDFSYLLRTLLRLVGLKLNECVQILASVCGLILLSALFSALRSSFRNERIGAAFSLCSTLAITLALLTESYNTLTAVTTYFENLNRFTAASIPLLGALYALGGNVGAAAASASGLSLYMTLMEELIGKTILPFCGICMALALVSALNPSIRLGSLLASVKKNYTTALAFLMMLLLAMLSAQTLLAAKGDTLLMRGAKFAAGNLIPVVGGSVAELLRSVSAGVGYLRGAVGICGVLLLLLLLLPTLVKLLLLRLTWQLSASLADLLGCATEKKLLEEFTSLLGYLIAAVTICSSILFLALTLLIRCASAIG